ncbi:MAG: hypothetical protein DRH21_04935 [Deltaproteobacteria bacterium]|nr:MAG: hypothetical protein DRH21_04935 [Deltaproteobacteria bacterium]
MNMITKTREDENTKGEQHQRILNSKQILYPIAYMIGILGFASVPDTQDYDNSWFSLNAIVNNFLHVPAYGILMFLWFRALRQKFHSKHRCFFYAVGITMAFGILQELVQSFVRGRFVSLADIGLDTIGIALAVLYIHKYQWT